MAAVKASANVGARIAACQSAAPCSPGQLAGLSVRSTFSQSSTPGRPAMLA